jgi:hypothetical protein
VFRQVFIHIYKRFSAVAHELRALAAIIFIADDIAEIEAHQTGAGTGLTPRSMMKSTKADKSACSTVPAGKPSGRPPS